MYKMSAPRHEVSLWLDDDEKAKNVHGSIVLALNFGRHRDMRNFTSVAK